MMTVNPSRRRTTKLAALQCWVLFLCATINLPLHGRVKNDDPSQLLNHLAGKWVLEGELGRRHSTHDVTAEWILNHEYLRFHEVSREKNQDGSPLYEAIIIMSWDNRTNEYNCLWLDNTDGGGLSVPIARGERQGRSIRISFPPPYD
jgi:hypothetical protein